MDKFLIVAVTGKQPAWARSACAEYLARLPRSYRAELRVLKTEARATGKPLGRRLAAEADRVRASVPRDAQLIVLDERGRDLTSAQFSAQLRVWAAEHTCTAFVVGGPDGLDAALTANAALRLRLSAFTLPHALAQVLLCEQLYRAASLIEGHPYHRE